MSLEHVEEHRWTRQDYERLAAQGFFRPGQRVELVEGVIYDRSPQSSHHSTAFRLAQEALRTVFPPEAVADSSLMHDRKRKIPLYARSGIPEAWLCNLVRRTFEIYRDPVNGAYQTRLVLRAGDTVSPLSQPEACLRISDLLP